MKPLQSLQQDFQRAVLSHLAPTGFFAREQASGGFNIYAQAYRARLAAALRDNYPVLYLALGDEMFAALAEAYIERQPSQFRSIRWFGGKLAEFMQSHAALTPHPALVDLARMDWALRQTFDAANEDPLTVSDLAALAPAEWPLQRFRLCAASAILKLHWRIGPLWQALNKNADAETAAPEPLEHSLLVWRQNLECKWRSLDPAEAAGLEALAVGQPFTDICERMMNIDPTMTPETAAMTLRQWVEQGLLARENLCDKEIY